MLEIHKKIYNGFANVRGKIFYPLIKLFVFLRITPNMLSYFGVLLMFLFVYFAPYNSPYLLYFILGAWFIDLLDGPLARHLKIDSDKGKFIDMICDALKHVLFILGVLYANLISGIIAVLLIVSFILSFAFRIIYNSGKYNSNWKFKSIVGPFPSTLLTIIVLHYILYLSGIYLNFNFFYSLIIGILFIDALHFYIKVIK